MSILYDTHLHTEFSTDSDTPISSQIEKAISLGLDGICITDHIDYDFPIDQCPGYDENPFMFDINSYISTIKNMQDKYPDFNIYTGVECGLQSDNNVIEFNKKLCKNPSLDQLIGSIHLIDKKDPYYKRFWEDVDPDKAIRHYFETTYDNIQKCPDFDILGHLDYVTRYAPSDFIYIPKKYFDITDEILKFLIKNDKALEVNSSALKKGYGYTNPHPDYLKRYKELGGSLITVGSDAHTPDALAYGFDKVSDMLAKLSYKEYAVFIKRKINLYPF